jgi:hypothetical protein
MINVTQSTFTLDQRSAGCHLHMINVTQSTFTLDQRLPVNHLHIINALLITLTHDQHFTKFTSCTWSMFHSQQLPLINVQQ